MSRIIAGHCARTRLQTLNGKSTRPTTDRVREALFTVLANWFGTAGDQAASQLANISFMDLYAGSGAIGLEAASRGAGSVYLVENNVAAVKIIKSNIQLTRLQAQTTVINSTVKSWLANPNGSSFDVIWSDPPYELSNQQITEDLEAIVNHWATSDSLVALERSFRTPAIKWPSGYSDQWTSKYGETIIYFARANAS